MVHHQAYTLAVCILIKCLNIEVRIRGYKVKYIVLCLTKPIFPTYIPTLYKHLVKTVLCRKVDKATHASLVCRVLRALLNL